jgi:Maf1 regulator
MKYIEIPELSRLAQALSHEGPECAVHTRIEAYSCKNIKRDKKLFKSLESAYKDEVTSSPPLPSFLADLDLGPEMTPFGPIDKHASRKTLYLLIATLNVAFPDYEFSDVRPAHFNKEESGASVLNALSNTLVSPHRAGRNAPRTYSSYPPTSANFFPNSVPTSSSPTNELKQSPFSPPQIMTGTHPTLYRTLDNVIRLSECEVYSYEPDIESDPHADDVDEDEDEVQLVSDEDSSSDDDGETFEFDDYDVDEVKPSERPSWIAGRISSGDSEDISMPYTMHMKRRGALLWSSHWFFLNRKLKRILFISVWARARTPRLWIDDEFTVGIASEKASGERFLGWEGAAGAGARAMGLSASV